MSRGLLPACSPASTDFCVGKGTVDNKQQCWQARHLYPMQQEQFLSALPEAFAFNSISPILRIL